MLVLRLRGRFIVSLLKEVDQRKIGQGPRQRIRNQNNVISAINWDIINMNVRNILKKQTINNKDETYIAQVERRH